MNPEKQSSESKVLEYNLLRDIVGNYSGLPVAFCLKEFLGWDDSKIKTFSKEYKKAKKARDKQFKQDSILCKAANCCGGSTSTQG